MKNKKIPIIFLIIAIMSFMALCIYEFQKKNNNVKSGTIQEQQNIDMAQDNKNNINEERKEVKKDTNIKMAVIVDIMCHN